MQQTVTRFHPVDGEFSYLQLDEVLVRSPVMHAEDNALGLLGASLAGVMRLVVENAVEV